VATSWSRDAGIRLLIKRDDLIHQLVSGNKWRKLLPVIARCRTGQLSTVVSVGGPYSNHIHALAFAGHTYGFAVEAYIRGYTLNTPTMHDAFAWGAICTLVSRSDYTWLKENPPVVSESALWLPEGGLTKESVLAFGGIADEAPFDVDHWFVASGSGCTALGIWLDLPPRVTLHEVPVYGLAGQELEEPAKRLAGLHIQTTKMGGWQPHVGVTDVRFGKLLAEQEAFIAGWESETGILLDPVYTGKLLWYVARLCSQSYFLRGQTILVHHTGGLQGRRR
jgi:1-aminocyclopropane-1-carboxylate deaminase